MYSRLLLITWPLVVVTRSRSTAVEPRRSVLRVVRDARGGWRTTTEIDASFRKYADTHRKTSGNKKIMSPFILYSFRFALTHTYTHKLISTNRFEFEASPGIASQGPLRFQFPSGRWVVALKDMCKLVVIVDVCFC